jgi:hypothetical protein
MQTSAIHPVSLLVSLEDAGLIDFVAADFVAGAFFAGAAAFGAPVFTPLETVALRVVVFFLEEPDFGGLEERDTIGVFIPALTLSRGQQKEVLS